MGGAESFCIVEQDTLIEQSTVKIYILNISPTEWFICKNSKIS